MRHVAPHRWADARAGRVAAGEVTAMTRHAAACPACARTRDRVTGASASFTAIKLQAPPELPWDSVRARIHWSVSSERRGHARQAPTRRWSFPLAAGALATGALALAVATGPVPAGELVNARSSGAPERDVVAASRAPAPTPPAALAGLVNRTTGEVMIDGIRVADVFSRRLVAGSVIATAEGRVDIQFAAASAFALGPRSMLELRRFDVDTIELVIEGTVDVEVSQRAPHQRFLVHAGERTVEVRGTQFRVHQDGGRTRVACRHGLVAVKDAHGQVEVGAALRVELAPDHAATADRVRPLSTEEVDDLAQATPLTLPMFDHLARSQASGWFDALLGGSAPLEIATVGRREVRVDGVELGAAPMRVRVMPGRHLVEAADAAGRFRRAGWVVVSAPSAPGTSRVEIPVEPPPTRGVRDRRRQFQSGTDKLRLAHCTRSIAKVGLTDTFVRIEIAVDAHGSVSFLNVIDTDLPSATATCVRNVLADIRFGAGAAATWRERIDL